MLTIRNETPADYQAVEELKGLLQRLYSRLRGALLSAGRFAGLRRDCDFRQPCQLYRPGLSKLQAASRLHRGGEIPGGDAGKGAGPRRFGGPGMDVPRQPRNGDFRGGRAAP